jgi:hypothetical protein
MTKSRSLSGAVQQNPSDQHGAESHVSKSARRGGPTGVTYTHAQGNVHRLTQQDLIALSLKESYEASQVMIGEAISVSELNAFIRAKKKDLACSSK